eukprot:scaffold7032_cov246-Pinguiococcus_pyrenoidosus.AAC.1
MLLDPVVRKRRRTVKKACSPETIDPLRSRNFSGTCSSSITRRRCAAHRNPRRSWTKSSPTCCPEPPESGYQSRVCRRTCRNSASAAGIH